MAHLCRYRSVRMANTANSSIYFRAWMSPCHSCSPRCVKINNLLWQIDRQSCRCCWDECCRKSSYLPWGFEVTGVNWWPAYSYLGQLKYVDTHQVAGKYLAYGTILDHNLPSLSWPIRSALAHRPCCSQRHNKPTCIRAKVHFVTKALNWGVLYELVHLGYSIDTGGFEIYLIILGLF